MHLVGILPEGPRYFGEGEQTDLPLHARLAELVREQALALTREEVPHALEVEVEEIEEGRVHARLFVETESQKGILVGKGGTMESALQAAGGHIAEGVTSCQSVLALAASYDVEMPLTDAVQRVCHKGLSVDEAVALLLGRSTKSE